MLLAGELKVAGNKNKHPSSRTRGLAIDGGDMVLALLERQAGELSSDALGALEFLALECKHRRILVEVSKPGPIGVERRVIVLHEGLRHSVWIHSRHYHHY